MLQTMPSDPIVEAIFDIRFDCQNPRIASVILSHLRASKFNSRFSSTEELPPHDLPAELKKSDPNFKFQPEFIMQGNKESILIGSSHLTISIEEPYPGWQTFKSDILTVLNLIQDLNENVEVNRVAFRYINLLQATAVSNASFKQINFEGSLGTFDLKQSKVAIGLELSQGDIQHKICVKSHETVTNASDDSISVGALLDIDTSSISDFANFWKEKDIVIERIRSAERNVFESLMKKDALKKFQNLLTPSYDSEMLGLG